MLIEVDDSSVSDALSAGGSSSRSQECIENLLLGHHGAKHVVWITPEQHDALKGVAEGFSKRAQGALRTIRAQATEIRGLRGRLRWRMRLGVGPSFRGDAVNEAGKQVILAAMHEFYETERLDRSVLLGEHLTDATFYFVMTEAYLTVLRWRASIVSFTKLLGGGHTTADAFQELVANGRIVIAVADSDRKHPADVIGGTAERLLPIPRKAFQHVHVLHTRFAENLISSTIYREAFARKANKLPALQRLCLAESAACSVPWRDHAELKHGLKLFRVRAMPVGSQEEIFWKQAAGDLGRSQCQQVGAPPCAKEEDCRCYVTDGLGRDALELSVEWLSRSDPARNARLLGITSAGPIGDLCEALLAWGIAPAARG